MQILKYPLEVFVMVGLSTKPVAWLLDSRVFVMDSARFDLLIDSKPYFRSSRTSKHAQIDTTTHADKSESSFQNAGRRTAIPEDCKLFPISTTLGEKSREKT